MKLFKYFLILFICTSVSQFSFAQEKPTITKVTKFKPPVVTSFLGNLIKTSTFGIIQGNADKIKAYSTAIYHNVLQKKEND